MIPRTLCQTIKHNLKPGFINLIYGPRRVGKTVLLQQLTQSTPKPTITWFNGDTKEARDLLGNTSEVLLSKLAAEPKTIVVDEAQRIPNIGLSLKILIDIKTVRRYLSLLEQSFVIFELGSFSRNLRKEVVKSKKYYFWDF